MQLARLIWPFPFLVRLGWATCRTANPDPVNARGRVFLLRGQAIVFSGGFGVLCDALRRQGIWAEDLRCVGDLWARRRLLADQRSGPVVFVGHSCGGRHALHAARALQPAGVTVDLVVGLDVAFPPLVTGNVKRAVNLYLGGRRIYPAGLFRAEPGSTTRIENIDLRTAHSPVSVRWLQHLTITNSAAVQAYVLGRILEAIATAQKPVE